MIKRIALPVALIAAFMVMAVGPAAASTGQVYYSPEQAGYAVTGARFKVAEVRVTLPNASHFAKELGGVGFGTELWSAGTVLDVGLYVCTDYSCRPGGTPVTRNYRPVFKVFNRHTGALICSTLKGTCPNVPSSWNNSSFAPGKSVNIALVYEPANGAVFASAEIGSSSASYDNYFLQPGLVFNQARIGADLGSSPWSTVPFRHPSSQIQLATFWVPTAPAFEAELGTYSGKSGCIASWWARHVLEMTGSGTSSGGLDASPGGLWNSGCDFRVYLDR